MLSILDQTLGMFSRIYLLASQLLLACLVILVGSQVVLRYATNHSIIGIEEVTALMFVWIAFLMSAVLHRRRRHITVTAISDMFPSKIRDCVDLLVSALTCVFCIFVFMQLYRIWPYLSHPTVMFGISEVAFKLALAVGIGTILLQEFVNIAAAGRRILASPLADE